MTFQKGYVPSNEIRRKLSEAAKRTKNHLGKKQSTETRQKISLIKKGKKVSDETRRKMSESHKGQITWNKGIKGWRSEEERKKINEKISQTLKGIKVSAETRKKLSIAHQKHFLSEQIKKKISKALTGIKKTDETRQKLSAANKGKVFSDRHKKKLSISHIGKQSGDKHYNWKGGKKMSIKRANHRRRSLGFIPLNECTIDTWVGHHMDKEHVMYIPKDIHTSTPHSLNNQETMDKINEIAINWYINYYGLI